MTFNGKHTIKTLWERTKKPWQLTNKSWETLYYSPATESRMKLSNYFHAALC